MDSAKLLVNKNLFRVFLFKMLTELFIAGIGIMEFLQGRGKFYFLMALPMTEMFKRERLMVRAFKSHKIGLMMEIGKMGR